MSLQQEQFCQLTNRFFEDIKRATKSGNEIKINYCTQRKTGKLRWIATGWKSKQLDI